VTPAWAERLRLAVSMGVGPEPFWRLSLPEWRALAEAPPTPVLGREGLQALMTAHPDEEAR
jgi:hypothetical protein